VRLGPIRETRAASLAAWVALVGLAASGCAHRAARDAAAGMAAQIQTMQANAPEEEQLVRVASTRAVQGAMAALDDPAQRQKIQELVNAAVTQAVASALHAALAPGAVAATAGGAGGPTGGGPGGGIFVAGEGRGPAAVLAGQIGQAATQDALGQVAAELGGQGALHRGIVATSAVATDAAVGAALGELFPECHGDDPATAAECRRGRVQSLTRATAASISAGVRDSLAWPLLFLAAAAGLTIGALAHWALTLRRRRPHAFRPV
jgi:hypothetical protein